jgi:tetratricopeptide (TPR) repeat protein
MVKKILPGKTILIFLLMIIFGACSSAPKRPAEITAKRTTAGSQLELANQEADRGNFAVSLTLLEEARRIAVSADDPPLLIRCSLARGNILFAQGLGAEAAEAWNAALAEADRSADRELAALCRVYMNRAKLLSSSGGGGAGGSAEAIRAEVAKDLALITRDKLAAALAWTVIGLAEKENRRWKEAEAAVKKALDIHQKESYLEEAAYDWYLIASIRSTAGNYDAALEALGEALSLDRRAENSFGLAADWRALGDVYRKMNRPADAEAAYRRSAAIFRAIGLEQKAAELEDR